jgi:hypothetical protein
MKNSVILSPYSHFVVITTIIVYALLVPIFFEMDNAFGGESFVVNNDETMMYSQQAIEEEVETQECKSPCLSSSEMCIEICA